MPKDKSVKKAMAETAALKQSVKDVLTVRKAYGKPIPKGSMEKLKSIDPYNPGGIAQPKPPAPAPEGMPKKPPAKHRVEEALTRHKEAEKIE